MRAKELSYPDPVEELAKQLPNLKKIDYDAIDELMQRICHKHKLSGQKLHDLFVKKYGRTPDKWIKQIKQRNEEVNEDMATVYVIYVDNKPVVKFNSPQEATNTLADLKKRFPGKPVTLKKINTGKTMYESTDGAPEFDEQQVKQFINWTIRRLHIQEPYPNFTFSKDERKAQAGHHTGVHTMDDNHIWIYVGKRNMIDILRTVFHELVHERQAQLNMIEPGDSYPGSPIEVMADMLAGKYIKIYGKQHPEIFQ